MFTPTIIKILRHLKDSREKASSQELAIIINEGQEYVNKALERLVAAEVVAEGQGLYAYNPTTRSEKLLANLLEVYERVDKIKSGELLIRAVVCEIPPRYLFHFNTLLELMDELGVARDESTQFLRREIEKAYLRRVRVARFGMRPQPAPRHIPSYWYSHLRMFRFEDLDDYAQDAEGATIQEDDYLIQQYPPQLVPTAREYLGQRREEIRARLRHKGLLEHITRF